MPLQLLIHKAIQVSHSSATYTGNHTRPAFGTNCLARTSEALNVQSICCICMFATQMNINIRMCSYQCNYETQPKQCYKLCMVGALWWILYFVHYRISVFTVHIFEPLIYILSAKTLLTDSTVNTR